MERNGGGRGETANLPADWHGLSLVAAMSRTQIGLQTVVSREPGLALSILQAVCQLARPRPCPYFPPPRVNTFFAPTKSRVLKLRRMRVDIISHLGHDARRYGICTARHWLSERHSSFISCFLNRKLSLSRGFYPFTWKSKRRNRTT